ncbi:MAG: hypothetical protein K6T78_04650 [Alicyclobacillus sp.]|nr:hypothetical protein [Alicyclobacillus sp.]
MTIEIPPAGAVPPVPDPAPKPLFRKLTWWVVALPILLFVALAMHSLYWLNFAHVISGVLWTGADIFMGFFVGPVLRRLNPDQRKAVITWLVPRTMLYLPVLAFTTGTAGWFMANWLHMLDPGNPTRPWIFAALTVITLLAVSGFGILLPNSIRTYLELQRKPPNIEKVLRLNRNNNRLAGVQGVLQVVIILIMARLVMG